MWLSLCKKESISCDFEQGCHLREVEESPQVLVIICFVSLVNRNLLLQDGGSFVSTLLDAGSNPNYEDNAGFPSIIAALSTERPDRLELIHILLQHGADPNMRGVNDWTPLHHAVSRRDAEAIRLLLHSGADPSLRTRIDDYETALEGAERAGFEAGASLLREAMNDRGA